MAAPRSRAIGLFATPLLHAAGVVEPGEQARLRTHCLERADQANSQCASLSHTAPLAPEGDPALSRLEDAVRPRLEEFGELLFGATLDWSIKELWFNVLQPGGFQALHNHANSVVSGVIYLTPVHESARTVFVKGMGYPGMVLSNLHKGVPVGPFNADKWVMPVVDPGDLILFPSWMLHEVPRNAGDLRITLAFNAVPRRLDAWGYQLGLAP